MTSQSYLYTELRKLIRSNRSDEDEDYWHFRKFHIQERDQPDYLQKIKKSLNQDTQHVDEILLQARYLAYLVNFQPDYTQKLQQQRLKYLTILFDGRNQSYVFKVMCKLILDDNRQILNDIQREMQYGYGQANVIFNLKILEEKMKWELNKKEKSISLCRNYRSKTFVGEALTFVCEMKTTVNTIIVEKIKILGLLFEFMGDQVKKYEPQLLTTLNECLELNFYNSDSLNILFLLIRRYIERFQRRKIFEMISPFIYRNINSLQNDNFMLILKEILSQTKEKPQEIPIEFMRYLEHNIIQTLLTKTQRKTPYKVRWLMIQLLIKFKTELNINSSRKIGQKISNRQIENNSLNCMMIAIVMALEHKLDLNQECLNHLRENNFYNQIFKDRKAVTVYKTVLVDFTNIHQQFEQFLCNPEIGQGIIEIFLTIKTTLYTNFQEISTEMAQNLLKTMLKFILIDLHAECALDIISELINKATTDLYGRIIKNLEVASIIREMIALIVAKIELEDQVESKMFVNLWNNLWKVVKIMHDKFGLTEVLNFGIFQACLQVISSIPQRYYNGKFFQACLKTLELALPTYSQIYNQQNFLRNHPSVKILIDILIAHPTSHFFKLYLQILNNIKESDNNALDFLTYKQAQITSLWVREDLGHFFDQFLANYDMAEFVIHKSAYSYDAEMMVWQIIIKNINLNHFSMMYDFFDLLKYFHHAISENHVVKEMKGDGAVMEAHLEVNVKRSIEIVKILDRKIQNSIFLQEIKEIMAFKVRILLHLCKVYSNYYRSYGSHQIQDIYDIIQDSLSQNKLESYIDFFHQNKKLTTTAYFCGLTQIMYIFLTPLVYSTSSQEMNQVNFVMGVFNLQRNFELTSNFMMNDVKKLGVEKSQEEKSMKTHLMKAEYLFLSNVQRWRQTLDLSQQNRRQ